MNGPRYRKLSEFAAHSGDVRCVRFGRKTAGVLVTGGDDKKVNVWLVGRTTASFSLPGHQSSVESVCFDNDEVVVATGGANGSIKLFELQAGKVTKSLQGHKSHVTCLSWHPYNSLIVSGSMDTNVKVWELKSKDPTMTIKGHGGGVSHVRFSPDGHWVASASQDGSVKVWDVRAGKMLTELLPPSKYEVTALEFSPTEYLLATCSKDRTVRLWDMDGSFHMGHQTAPETGPVRNITFSKDGKHMFAAVQDLCRVYSVDPPEPRDYLDVPWYKVSDLMVGQYRGGERLLGVSFHSTMVGVFEIPLRSVKPFSDDPDYMLREQGASVDGNPAAASRGNFLGVASAAHLPPEGALRRVSLNDRSNASAAASAAPYNGGAAYTGHGSRPSSSSGPAEQAAGASGVGRSMERAGAAGSAGRLPPHGSSSAANGARPAVSNPLSGVASSNKRYADVSPATSHDFDGPASRVDEPAPSRSAVASAGSARPPMVSIGVGVGESLMRGQLQPEEYAAGSRPQAQPRQRPVPSQRDSQPEDDYPPAYARQAQQLRMEAMPDPYGAPVVGPSADQRYPWLGGLGQGSSEAGPSGLDRRGGSGMGSAAYHAGDAPSDLETTVPLSRQHATTLNAAKKRAHTLSLIRNFAAKADWRGAINCARRCDDPGAYADLLDAMYERRDAFSLDLVGEVVSLLDIVLTLPTDRQVQVGLNVITLLVRSFGTVIRDLCAPAARGLFIDISFEERRERADKARLALVSLAPKVKSLSRLSMATMSQAQDVVVQLSQLEVVGAR